MIWFLFSLLLQFRCYFAKDWVWWSWRCFPTLMVLWFRSSICEFWGFQAILWIPVSDPALPKLLTLLLYAGVSVLISIYCINLNSYGLLAFLNPKFPNLLFWGIWILQEVEGLSLRVGNPSRAIPELFHFNLCSSFPLAPSPCPLKEDKIISCTKS